MRCLTRTFQMAAAFAGVLLMAAPSSARPWTRAYVAHLPDSAFAALELQPTGTVRRHLPHHDANGRLDLAHVRNALGRVSQVHWSNPANAAAARAHLLAHLEAAKAADVGGGAHRGSPRARMAP